MNVFEMKNLDKNIHDKKTAFIENEHYKNFNCKIEINNKIKIKKNYF